MLRPIQVIPLAVLLVAGPLSCREEPPPAPAPNTAANAPSRTPPNDPIAPATVEIHLPDIDVASTRSPASATPTEWMFDTSAWETALSATGENVHLLDPNEETDVVLLLQAGQAALKSKRTARAIRCFRRASGQQSRSLDALRGLALALTADGQVDEALRVYHRILQTAPDDRTARYNFAVACSRLGRRALAEKTYRQLLAEDRSDAPSRYNLACLLQKNGELAAAEKHWKTLAELDPNSPAPWTAMGEIHLDQKEYKEATQDFAQAAQRDTSNAMAWLAFSDAARLSGSFGLAMAGATRAMRADPNHPLPPRRLGKLQILVGRSVKDPNMVRDGLDHCRKSLAIDPSQDELAAWLKQQPETAAER
ncbi:MAG: tetratricopeptide repeat protein [Planctomycetota bacterium]